MPKALYDGKRRCVTRQRRHMQADFSLYILIPYPLTHTPVPPDVSFLLRGTPPGWYNFLCEFKE